MSGAVPRTVVCLGNPGAEYSATRHNVAWWLADLLAEGFDLGRFRREGPAAIARGRVEGIPLQVVKPLTYMNLSGRVLRGLSGKVGSEFVRHLLVAVDEVALEPGRVRFRAGGSAGGHNGLRSVEAALGTQEYARVRIGVGAPPPGANRSDWVLSAPSRADRQLILEAVDGLVDCVAIWAVDGIESAMNRCNN